MGGKPEELLAELPPFPRPARAAQVGVHPRLGARRDRRRARGRRPEDARRGDERRVRGRDLDSRMGASSSQGMSQDQVVHALEAAGQQEFANMVGAMQNFAPGEGVDFETAAHGRAVGRRDLCRLLDPAVAAGLHRQRHHGAHHVAGARRHRAQDQQPAAESLRQGAARRADQPRDERRRQHDADPAAIAVGRDHLVAHGRGRARHDVLDLVEARSRRAHRPAAHRRHHGRHRPEVTEGIPIAVEEGRPPQLARRGVVLGPRAREGLRTREGHARCVPGGE